MTTYRFPPDLLQAQRDWNAVYAQLATAQHPAQTTVLRRTLQRLSVRISTHPFWAGFPGTAPAARMELKRVASAAVQADARGRREAAPWPRPPRM